MKKTLNQILQDMGAYLDQDTALPSGTELTMRINLANQALQEWGNAYQWRQLRIPSSITVNLSQVSVGLTDNFKKFMSPIVDMSTSSKTSYTEIRPEERFGKNPSDNYFYVDGDFAIGRYITINPALSSGMSMVFDYQSFPSSMATLQDICVCPDPEFVVKRAISTVLETRSDTRFPQVKADAELLLRRMIEEEDTPSGGNTGRVGSYWAKSNFRPGRD